MTVLAPPCEYVSLSGTLSHIPASWRVADVGPGNYPLLRADVFIDHDTAKLRPVEEMGKQAILANLDEGLPQIQDKAFDFVWCSHVLEHVQDPARCAAALSRIGKSGVVVMPSAFKDALFNWEEPTHIWHVLPYPKDDGPPIFIKYNRAYIDRLRDELVQQATCTLYRIGTDHDYTAERHLPEWFSENEHNLDVIVHWEGELKIQVIG